MGAALFAWVVVGGGACGGGGGAATSDAATSKDSGTGDGNALDGVAIPSDSNGSDGSATPNALCQELVSTLCTRSNQCMGADASVSAQPSCNTLEAVAFGCDRATSAGFPACLNDVKALSCASLFPAAGGLGTPTSCDEPLNSIPLSDAQMKCVALADVVCQKVAMCSGIVAPTSADLMQCESDVASQIQCGFAVDVSATYDQCLVDFPNVSCGGADGGAADGGTDAGGLSLPTSCAGVIKGVQ
jgi:hypothetical protein